MCGYEQFMRRAIELARQTSIDDKAGGPFGCVIVKDGEIIGEGANRVIADCDPTSHGEMNAIRAASKTLGTHDLSGCTVFTSGEPCPMCYAACSWARVDAIYFASTIRDATEFGDFDDEAMSKSIQVPIQERDLAGSELLRNEMLEIWKEYSTLPDKQLY